MRRRLARQGRTRIGRGREHIIAVDLYLQERIETQAEQTQMEHWDHMDSIRHVESSPCS